MEDHDMEQVKAMMLEGSVFYQYVYRGPVAQRRRIQLCFSEATNDATLGALYWCSEFGERVKNTKDLLYLHRVSDIYMGKQTKILQTGIAKDAAAECCFSLISKSQVLDLEAESTQVLSAWLFGINSLVNGAGTRIVCSDGDNTFAVDAESFAKAQSKDDEKTFRSADEVFSGMNNAPPLPLTGRESSARLSLVGFLNQKQTRVLALEKKIDRLTGKLDSKLNQEKEAPTAVPRQLVQPACDAATVSLMKREVQEQLEVLKADFDTTVATIMEATELSLADLRTSLALERKKRRAAVNKMIEIQGNIRVFCRVRPLNKKEISEKDSMMTSDFYEDSMMLNNRETDAKKRFTFDQVFPPGSTQEAVFAEVAPLVDSCLSGFTVCIFAYGQTGAGKTYTMEGPANDRGVNYRALDHLFQSCQDEHRQNPQIVHRVSVSVVEIYNEEVRDLLGVGGARMELRVGPQGVYVPGLHEREVTSTAQVQQLMLKEAYPNRSVRGTSMNEHSSRSHCLVFIKCTALNETSMKKTEGTMILIDLAGSERVKKSEAAGDSMKEAQAINKSLSALGNVISSLQKGSSHVPFRDSKLTFLLQNSLGGSCKCLMICQVSPASANFQETSCSLLFANRVRSTKLGQAKKNIQDTSVQKEKTKAVKEASKAQHSASQFKDQVKTLERTLSKRESSIDDLHRKVAEQEREIASLRNKKAVAPAPSSSSSSAAPASNSIPVAWPEPKARGLLKEAPTEGGERSPFRSRVFHKDPLQASQASRRAGQGNRSGSERRTRSATKKRKESSGSGDENEPPTSRGRPKTARTTRSSVRAHSAAQRAGTRKTTAKKSSNNSMSKSKRFAF